MKSVTLTVLALTVLFVAVGEGVVISQEQKALDPAGWGGNHIDKPIPEYVHGDECLFCHRNNIGPTWQKNPHGIAVRQSEDAPELARLFKDLAAVSPQVEYFLGGRHRVRFLKKSGYGKFSILNVQGSLSPTLTLEGDKQTWDDQKFANRCAGCHTTGVDSKTKSFTAFGIDCYACHGDATLDHTKDTSLMWLSKKRRDDARAITSICAQCHLRMGKSRSTGLPYANTFIAGDNLFRDFEVDFSKADDETLNAGDRHVLRSVRDVAVRGELATTCLSCHDVHDNSTTKHREVVKAAICADCHGVPFKPTVKRYEVHSPLCEY
jgi:cytochrome c553